MANLFLKQAKQYVATRPSYPPELFDFIASKTPRRDLAWDVGTGNGQAAASVSPLLLLLSFFFLEKLCQLRSSHHHQRGKKVSTPTD
jgi:hypothetical protein